jgi:hypothetical protein
MAWWNRKQEEPEPVHVETNAEYWAKRNAEREAREAEANRLAEVDDDGWIGYPAPTPTAEEADEFRRLAIRTFVDDDGKFCMEFVPRKS